MSHLGRGYVDGGAGREAADDDVVDEEAEAAKSEESYQGLYEADTEGDGSDNLQAGGGGLEVQERCRAERRTDQRTGEVGGQVTVLVLWGPFRRHSHHHLHQCRRHNISLSLFT